VPLEGSIPPMLANQVRRHLMKCEGVERSSGHNRHLPTYKRCDIVIAVERIPIAGSSTGSITGLWRRQASKRNVSKGAREAMPHVDAALMLKSTNCNPVPGYCNRVLLRRVHRSRCIDHVKSIRSMLLCRAFGSSGISGIESHHRTDVTFWLPLRKRQSRAERFRVGSTHGFDLK
jgi:hypothetical protein